MQHTTKTAAGQGFRGLLQAHWRWFFWFTGVGAALRVWFVLRFPAMPPDSVLYGHLAKNWLLHHVYGIGSPPAPTYIRLPGYPAFMVAVWAIFGIEHYNAVRFAQVVVDLGTCFVVADLARRVVGFWNPTLANPARVGHPNAGVGHMAAKWAFALAAVCPFLANYTAVPLTETLAIFFAAVALDFAIAALGGDPHPGPRPGPHSQENTTGSGGLQWAGCGLAIAAGIYLRPDGGIVLIAIGGYLLWRLMSRPHKQQTLRAAVVLAACSLLPLAPWTARNWRVYHRFQPLAPTHANEPGEFFAAGFEHWMHTWLVDYASLEDIGFRMDSEDLDVNTLPARSFDNEQERARVEQMFEQHNQNDTMTPELDAQFEQLARERVQRKPLRSYGELPALRILDLWLRPRTEMLPLDTHWWRWREDPHDFAWSLLLAAINAGYLALAIMGARRYRELRWPGLLAGFVVARTILITAVAYPEPRYVLECFPVVIVMAAVALGGRRAKPNIAQ